MAKIHAGVDAGKEIHWLAVVDDSGNTLLSRRLENSQEDITRAIDEVAALGKDRTWAVDMPGGVASLLLALLWYKGEKVVSVPGMTVNRSRDTYPGEAKTDERDAYVIADQARMRSGLKELVPAEDVRAELSLLVSHRRDLVADQTRVIARLRDTMVSLFPGLERVLDFKSKGALLLISRYQTPSQVRKAGIKRVENYLRAQGAVKAPQLASKAMKAAQAQTVKLPAEDVASRIVADLAAELLKLKERLAAIDMDSRTVFLPPPGRDPDEPSGHRTSPGS